ncbi:DUF6339 family protein [Spirillospora sp. NPDC048832]
MTVQRPARPVARFALLAEREASEHLTSAVLQRLEDLPQNALEKACEPLPDEARWDAAPVRELLDEAMERFDEEPTKADAWVAPRLHATLRLSRREAADSRLWNFMAMRLAPDYVFWRNPPRASPGNPVPQVNKNHFIGAFHKQAFARLWWAAEFFRNGVDYRPVEIVCRNQETFNSALRLEIVYHRATAQTMARLMSDGTIRTTREANAFFKAVNAAGSTLFFDVMAPDEPWDADAHRAWVADAGTAHVQYESLPDGPDDWHVPDSAVDALTPLFRDLFVEAPIRGREQTEIEE